jgi:hypothetical protein
MRKTLLTVVLLGVFGSGCDLLQRHRVSFEAEVEVQPEVEAPPGAPVQAEDITADNAYEKAKALENELNKESAGQPLP